MRDTLRRVMYSRAVWFAAVIILVYAAGKYWYRAVSEGFSGLKTVQVVITTGLAAMFAWQFVANRAWRKRNNDAQ